MQALVILALALTSVVHCQTNGYPYEVEDNAFNPIDTLGRPPIRNHVMSLPGSNYEDYYQPYNSENTRSLWSSLSRYKPKNPKLLDDINTYGKLNLRTLYNPWHPDTHGGYPKRRIGHERLYSPNYRLFSELSRIPVIGDLTNVFDKLIGTDESSYSPYSPTVNQKWYGNSPVTSRRWWGAPVSTSDGVPELEDYLNLLQRE